MNFNAQFKSAVCVIAAGFTLSIFVPAAWAARTEEPWIAGSMTARAKDVGDKIILPLKRTDVDIDITGGVVKARVTQIFENNTKYNLEAVYAFPLPSRATVTGMEIQIDDRLISSVVKERKEAKQTYEEAKKQGKTAALLEQERPNLFTMSVANFAPGETAEVRLTYVEQADFQTGVYSVTFPMTIGPKYMPANGPQAVPDADRVTPPVLPPWIDANHRLKLEATVSGIPVKEIRSNTHAIRVQKRDKTQKVWLRNTLVIPNKDFNMEIVLPDASTPEFSLVKCDADGSEFGMFTVFPPTLKADGPKREVPRDVVFLIDTSGSMSGASIAQAKAGLKECLTMLRPADQFTIVRFSSDHSAFSPDLRPATPEKLREADAFVDSLQASGGTEMQRALDYVLDYPSNPEALKMIVFLTDGAVGNEDSLMRLLNEKLDNRRLFTFGIGSAPNEHLMRKMGELGHGQSRFIRSQEDVGKVMADFFRTLEAPVLTDIELAWEDRNGRPIEVASYPSVCSDVFYERPLQVVANSRAGFDGGALKVHGKLAGQPVSYQFAFAKAVKTEDGAVDKLFGRAHIDELMFQLLQADTGDQRSAAEGEVLKASLHHQLVSQFTSRVAVEEKLKRDGLGRLVRVKVPNAFPEGWDADQFFGTATTATKHLILGALALLLALGLGVVRYQLGRTLRSRASMG